MDQIVHKMDQNIHRGEQNITLPKCLFIKSKEGLGPFVGPFCKTTNGSKSFHRTYYNGQFYHPHPHIYLVIKVLMAFQSETEIKIRSITLYNDQKILSEKEKERMEFSIYHECIQ